MKDNGCRIYMGPAGGQARFTAEQLAKVEGILNEHLKGWFAEDSQRTVKGVMEELRTYIIPDSSQIMGFALDSVQSCFDRILSAFPDAFLMLERGEVIIQKHQPGRID